ncbi:MAG: PQQ-dependent sugar dehydrogenase [Gemmatimonadota bacterium]
MTALLAILVAGCTADSGSEDGNPSLPETAGGDTACAADNDGLTLMEGFCVAVFHEGVGSARHVTVAPNGDVWVALREAGEDGEAIVALRDTTGDGVADVEERFGGVGGSGILYHEGWLYFAPDDRVMRYPMTAGELTPSGEPETLVEGLPVGGHRSKSLAITADGRLLVNIGSASNACQEETRTPGSPGQDPCPELDERAGVWAFARDVPGQTQADGQRYATGLRNAYALAVHPTSGQVYATVHGRDQLHGLWPDRFTQEQSAEKPAEEFVAIDRGDDFGWPYCYYDPAADRKVLAPEFGGDGTEVGRCAEAEDPLIDFPAHWAPNDLTFVTGGSLPLDGAVVAFHGSWNRAPLPQQGYNVVFAPFQGGAPTGEWEVLAEGFPMGNVSPDGATYRPTGVATTPDGALLIVDGKEGRIWKVAYQGTTATGDS